MEPADLWTRALPPALRVRLHQRGAHRQVVQQRVGLAQPVRGAASAVQGHVVVRWGVIRWAPRAALLDHGGRSAAPSTAGDPAARGHDRAVGPGGSAAGARGARWSVRSGDVMAGCVAGGTREVTRRGSRLTRKGSKSGAIGHRHRRGGGRRTPARRRTRARGMLSLHAGERREHERARHLALPAGGAVIRVDDDLRHPAFRLVTGSGSSCLMSAGGAKPQNCS